MKIAIKVSLACVVMMSVGTTGAQAEEGMQILSDLKFKGQLRPRYEFTDSEASTNSAGNSLTNRSRLNIEAGLFELESVRATIELNAVNDFKTLEQSTHQSAAEADVAKMSQANIAYKADAFEGVIGRKTLNLDNQRFVGSVDWKQNFQTLDLVSISYNTKRFELLTAYLYGVNAIGDAGNGEAGAVYTGSTASGETNSAIVNAGYGIADEVKLTAYGYLLGSHSDTYGLALSGNIAGETAKFSYRAEYAMQAEPSLQTNDRTRNTNADARYINLEASTDLNGFLAGLNYESLGANEGSGTAAFQTPLATKHKFNGWADLFLVTPAAGLVDMNVMLGYKSKSFGTAKALYHRFESDEGSINYGSELDLLYTKAFAGLKNVTGMAKAGIYMAGDSQLFGNYAAQASDVTKFWLMLDYSFSL